MPRFFVTSEQFDENFINVCGEDAKHISKSLRMKKGEFVTVCDMQGNEYECKIENFSDTAVRVKIISKTLSKVEPPFFIKLFQALPKSDKLDFIIQKAVECGVGEIIPFESERCIVKSKPADEERKRERRNRIALEAAKQCGRTLIPNVRHTVSFETAVKEAAESTLGIFCYEGDGTEPLGSVLRKISESAIVNHDGDKAVVSVVIGSEGGFSLREADCAKEAGLVCTGLGKRILRCETAPVFVLSCISLVSELDGFMS